VRLGHFSRSGKQFAAQCADQNDGRIAMLLGEVAEQFQAIHLRHVQIADQDIDRLRLGVMNDAQRLLPVAGFADRGDGQRAQHVDDDAALKIVVLDHQQMETGQRRRRFVDAKGVKMTIERQHGVDKRGRGGDHGGGILVCRGLFERGADRCQWFGADGSAGALHAMGKTPDFAWTVLRQQIGQPVAVSTQMRLKLPQHTYLIGLVGDDLP